MCNVTRNRGAALVIVLAVLAVLALLGTVFAGLSSVDKKVSRSYLDEIRARLIARAGVERAITEIQGGITRGAADDPAMQFWGNNVEEEGTPDWTTPLTKAMNPSYAWEDENVQDPLDANKRAKLFAIDGQKLGISGAMGTGTYAQNGDVYRLLVVDANSRINVNDGVEPGPRSNVSLNLRRILNVLGDLLRVEQLGKRILEGRPEYGYRTKRELEKILGSRDFPIVSPHITTHSWSDPNVCNPVPLSGDVLDIYPIKYNDRIGLYRYGRSHEANGDLVKTPLVFAPEFCKPDLCFRDPNDPPQNGFTPSPPLAPCPNAVIAQDELNCQWVERVRRSPVNVNLASKEVLTALITDLRGFFMAERRKHNPAANEYSFMFHFTYDNAPGVRPGDELGFLYTTPAFLRRSEMSAEGDVTADDIAEEIVACRTRKFSPHCKGVDYGGLWYGGPFLTWRQFYAFCDGLVTGKLLQDPRKIFWDYAYPDNNAGSFMNFVGEPSGSDNRLDIVSPIQRDFAAQAMADVLKANFNPNFTPNEANPDQNLYLAVDKTDLICNSTEFCFTPMGIFDIESEGLIVNTEGSQDLLKTQKGHVVARQRIAVTVKAYDAYRETSQSEFYRGEFGRRSAGSAVTNNNRTMECGPEADNGAAPSENRSCGWIQLSTVGGPWLGMGAGHARGATVTTPIGHPEQGDVAHAHFTFDQRLNYHAERETEHGNDQEWEEPLLTPTYKNQPDRTETCMGPYGPTKGLPGQYRIVRDYSWDKLPPDPSYHATSDLRHDGAYVERDSALMYQNTINTYGTQGTVCYWIKPSFHPEMTGKPRTYFTMDTRVEDGAAGGRQFINGQWFFASHDRQAYQHSPNELPEPTYPPGPWRPCSMAAGFAPRGFGGVGAESASLNHRGHDDKKTKDVMAHHKWVHVGYSWDLSDLPATRQPGKCMLMINGKMNGDSQIWVHPSPGDEAQNWIDKGCTTFRLGEPSKTAEWPGFWGTYGVRGRNWTADATMDEFFMWKGKKFEKVADIYGKGRYYRPRPGREAQFTSQPMSLDAGRRNLTPPSTSKPPASGHDTVVESGGAAGGSYRTTTTGVNQMRILGAAWTAWQPDENDPMGAPVVIDHANGALMQIEIELQFLIDDQPVGPIFKRDGGDFSDEIIFSPPGEAKYRFKVRIPDATSESVLMSSPTIDDVTVFFTMGVEFLSYELVD